jgi:hypothetical protein
MSSMYPPTEEDRGDCQDPNQWRSRLKDVSRLGALFPSALILDTYWYLVSHEYFFLLEAYKFRKSRIFEFPQLQNHSWLPVLHPNANWVQLNSRNDPCWCKYGSYNNLTHSTNGNTKNLRYLQPSRDICNYCAMLAIIANFYYYHSAKYNKISKLSHLHQPHPCHYCNCYCKIVYINYYV